MTAMRDRVGIGQTWRRRRDGLVVIVRQVHRAERLVEVRPVNPSLLDNAPRSVTFGELRHRWALSDDDDHQGEAV
jgi:hypothetical protein